MKVLFTSDLAFNKAIREIGILCLLEARLSWLKYLCRTPSQGTQSKHKQAEKPDRLVY